MDPSFDTPRRSGASRGGNLALLGLLAIAAFFLLTEHRAHLLGWLPLALLLLCPLLHLLMHGGHGGHGGHADDDRRPAHHSDGPDPRTSTTPRESGGST